ETVPGVEADNWGKWKRELPGSERNHLVSINSSDLMSCVVGHEELFGEDLRQRIFGKVRPVRKSKSETMTSIGGSNSSNPFEDMMLTEFCLKREAAKSAYEVAKEKDRTVMRLEKFSLLSRRICLRTMRIATTCKNNKSKTNIICTGINL
nr:hypothetical protein [Tanacetum cinerariifolium]